MHEQCIEINALQTNRCKSSLCPLMIRAKTASGCELTNHESNQARIRQRITWVYTMRDL